jgi:hypothetical protein
MPTVHVLFALQWGDTPPGQLLIPDYDIRRRSERVWLRRAWIAIQ